MRGAARNWSIAVGCAAVGVVLALTLSSCGEAHTTADRMLDSAPMPATGHASRWKPLGAPDAPATVPACHPLTDRTRYWTTADDVATVQSWLESHPGDGLRDAGSMTGPGDDAAVVQQPITRPRGAASVELEFTLVSRGDATIVRVDALVVPLGSGCSSSG